MFATGYPFYGQDVGVLVFSTVTPRAPGDAGNAASFSYPVRYEVVQGGFADLVEGGPAIKANLLAAGQNLVKAGIKAIVGDCGMMSLYQDCLGAELGIPFAGSSLCQIPMIWQLIGRSGSIGVITGHSGLLKETHLRASGWTEDIRLSIQGMQEQRRPTCGRSSLSAAICPPTRRTWPRRWACRCSTPFPPRTCWPTPCARRGICEAPPTPMHKQEGQ